MIIIKSKPAIVATDGNPIVFTVKTDNLLCRYIICKVFVESEIYKNDFTLSVPLESPPNASRETSFDLQDTLFNNFASEIGNINSNKAYFCKKTSLFYKVTFAELQGSQPTNEITTEAFCVVHAKFGFLDFMQKNESLLPSLLLTEKPKTRTLETSQIDFVYFFPLAAELVDLTFDLTCTDQTKYQFTQQIQTRKYEICAIPTGFVQQFYKKFTERKNIDFIKLTFKGFTINYEVFTAKKSFKTFVFANTLGGFDTLLCLGNTSETLEVEKVVSQRILSNSLNDNLGEFVNYSNISQKMQSVNSGFLDKNEMASALNIFASTQVFEYVDSRLIPVIIESKKAVVKDKKDYLNAIEFEYKYAFNL